MEFLASNLVALELRNVATFQAADPSPTAQRHLSGSQGHISKQHCYQEAEQPWGCPSICILSNPTPPLPFCTPMALC